MPPFGRFSQLSPPPPLKVEGVRMPLGERREKLKQQIILDFVCSPGFVVRLAFVQGTKKSSEDRNKNRAFKV